jgi:hypothetical protein
MPIVDANRQHPYSDTLKPRRFGASPTLDPQMFSRMDDFAEQAWRGTSDGRYSPAEVAARLEQLSQSAEQELAAAKDANPATARAVADIKIQIALGKFFCRKFRAGVFYSIFLQIGSGDVLAWALDCYHRARQAYGDAAEIGKRVYVKDVTFGIDYFGRGNWEDRLAAIDADIQDMEKIRATGAGPTIGGPGISIKGAIDAVMEPPARPNLPFEHVPSSAFVPGDPMTIEVSIKEIGPRSKLSVSLFYRQVNQAEAWQNVEMNLVGENYVANIPESYTQSPYAMQYYFQVRDSGRAWLLPGFNSDWSNQPYFVVPQRPA